MKPIITFLFILLSASLGVARDSSKKSPEAEVRELLGRSATAYQKGDYDATEKLWAHGDEVSVFESGYANYGWNDYRDNHLKPELAEMKNVRFAFSDIKSRVDRSMAWATFKFTITADYEGKKIDSAGIGTAILERYDTGWKIVHMHTSAPRRKPAP